jgi:hypothetical protein
MEKQLQNAIQLCKEEIEMTLMGIVKKANNALDINGGEGHQLTYVNSNVNGIGDDYQALIRTVEKLNTYIQISNTQLKK